jgi:hypothetical protein
MAAIPTDMPRLLRHFFIQNRQVSIPGIGSFHLVRIPARVDVASRQLLAPGYSVQFDPLQDNPTADLFSYISRKTLVNEWEAIGMLNEFGMGLKDRLRTGKKFIWEGVGTLETIPGGQVILRPANMDYNFMPGVPSTRVIRKDASHTVLVGETERSSNETRQSLEEDVVVARAGWWVSAAVIAAIALGLIFFRYFSDTYRFVTGKQSVITTSVVPQQYEENKAR